MYAPPFEDTLGSRTEVISKRRLNPEPLCESYLTSVVTPSTPRNHDCSWAHAVSVGAISRGCTFVALVLILLLCKHVARQRAKVVVVGLRHFALG